MYEIEISMEIALRLNYRIFLNYVKSIYQSTQIIGLDSSSNCKIFNNYNNAMTFQYQFYHKLPKAIESATDTDTSPTILKMCNYKINNNITKAYSIIHLQIPKNSAAKLIDTFLN